MDNNPPNDFSALAQELNIPAEKVRNTLDLLSQGNTVPFIARFRKDETGGLENDQIRLLQQRAAKIKALGDRKATILKTIRSQNKLTPDLEASIEAATSTKLLEDLYLPFKPRKQTLASQARQNGLETLAGEILSDAEVDLEQRAAEFAGEGKKVSTAEEALQGASHIIAEGYSERADLRQKLRTMLRETGRIVCSRFEEAEAKASGNQEKKQSGSDEKKQEEPSATATADADKPAEVASDKPAETNEPTQPETSPAATTPKESASEPAAQETTAEVASPAPARPEQQAATTGDSPETTTPEATANTDDSEPAAGDTAQASPQAAGAEAVAAESSAVESPAAEADANDAPPAAEGVVSQDETPATVEAKQPEATPSEEKPAEAPAEQPVGESATAASATPPATEDKSAAATQTDTADLKPAADDAQAKLAAKEAKKKKAAEKKAAAREKKASISKQQKQEAKRKKRARLEASFKDYFKFNEPISKLPPHRILAINRGERVRILKVKFEYDAAAVQQAAIELAVPAEHPRREMLVAAARDAVSRLVMPALEREVRRELTEQSEVHAVAVFARNLRKLLLQPPVRNKRVLAIDPGFRSGCKLTALDEFGTVLGYAIIHVIGREDRCRHGRAKLVELIKQHKIDVIAIGNGAACRETEQLVAGVIADELKETDVRYTIVNEAGASVYSTSAIGREELPTYDAVLRSAVSIGRRLIDPLSELVKINPSNIGVGMYQHDVKATHLRDTLDGVVEACVNYVGVDVNSASPALLRYVSGMNQLTARRVYEHRQNNGPFKTREELKKVAGLGEQTFEQAAGFLRISSGDNPLDSTWIHPESYEAARTVLEKLDASVDQLALPAEPETKQKFGGELIADEPAAEEATSEATSETAAPADAEPEAGTTAEETVATPPADTTAEDASTAEATAESTADAVAEPTAEADAKEPAAEPASSETSSSETAAALPAEQASSEPAAAEAATPHSQAIAQRAKLLAELAAKADGLDTAKLAAELNIGELLLRDLLADLVRPGRDPREDLPAPDFRRGIMKLEDLEPGMQLSGTVLNVVDFGAFVDIGLSDSGLVHISRLAGHYISDPHDVVSVGDIITVWVVEVDAKRRRVSLTAIAPGSETQRERPPRQKRPPRKPAAKSGDRPPRQGGKRPPRGDRRGKDNRRGGGGRSYTPKKPPKPVKPITKDMEEGKEPMRSFSDLKQLFEKKKDDGKKK